MKFILDSIYYFTKEVKLNLMQMLILKCKEYSVQLYLSDPQIRTTTWSIYFSIEFASSEIAAPIRTNYNFSKIKLQVLADSTYNRPNSVPNCCDRMHICFKPENKTIALLAEILCANISWWSIQMASRKQILKQWIEID